jgi:hypothetical protein
MGSGDAPRDRARDGVARARDGLTALGTVLGLRTTFLRPYVGLIERGFYAAFLAWIFLVSSRLAGA